MATLSYTAERIDELLAEVDSYGDLDIKGFKAAGSSGSSNNYRVFARCPINATGVSGSAVLLVAGGTSIAANSGLGVYIVQIYNRNSTFELRYTKIAPDNNTAVFGWYDGGDGYYYIGIYRGSYPAAPEIIELFPPSLTYALTYSVYYDGSTAPTGWTAGTAA